MTNNLAKLELLESAGILAENANVEIAIQTAAGIYLGKLYNPANEDEENIMIEAIIKTRNSIRESEKDLNNPVCVFLTDVVLLTGSLGKVHMSFVNIFIDQIIGISLNDPNLEEE